MIDYIKGEIAGITPATVVVECCGIGYELNISLNTYTAIQRLATVKLYVYEAIREDAHLLYGFATREERELFTMLITVSGIGGNTARMILSSLSPAELCEVISSGNDKLLKSVKGIGLKTAQRIIVDLRDKLRTGGLGGFVLSSDSGGGNVGGVGALSGSSVMEEAVQALTMLGFAQSPSSKVVQAIVTELPTAPVEQVIKLALKRL